MKPIVSGARLREVLRYNPETGAFVWLKRTSNRVAVGDVAGHTNSDGYVLITVHGRIYRASRLAVLWMTGEQPGPEVDHADHDRSNNRWSNLRSGDKSLNMQNMTRPKRGNKVGLLGVSWDARNKNWKARITVDRACLHIGNYATPELASAAYVSAKRQLHKGNTL